MDREWKDLLDSPPLACPRLTPTSGTPPYTHLWPYPSPRVIPSLDPLQIAHALQGRYASFSSLSMAASLALHLILLPILTFPQCERSNFLSCFSDFHNILPSPCPAALAAALSPLNSKMPIRVSPGIDQQRLIEGGRLSEALRSWANRPGSRPHRACNQCMESCLPLPVQAES